MEFNDREPIYLQVIEHFKHQLVNGTFKPGQEVPSRRELAKTFGINPNTAQRAYKEMEDAGIIKTVRGQGSYMTDDQQTITLIQREMLDEIVKQFVETMRTLGKNDAEIVNAVEKYL